MIVQLNMHVCNSACIFHIALIRDLVSALSHSVVITLYRIDLTQLSDLLGYIEATILSLANSKSHTKSFLSITDSAQIGASTDR